MFSYLQSVSPNALSLLLIVAVTLNTNNANDYSDKQADEYIMTSAVIDGLKRSSMCGEGYRIEGVLLKSYPYSKSQAYLPYENCYMTFQARRSGNQIRIRVLTLDINDIHGGVNCLDSLRFYKSVYLRREDKIDFLECGQISESENINLFSPTGIVTAHFSTDGGNVSGLGFQVVLTAFRYPNKTHPCDPYDEEFLCSNAQCISSSLLCDGVAHCQDASDEFPSRCHSNIGESTANQNMYSKTRDMINKHQHWRGVSILVFLFLIFIALAIFIVYFIYRRFARSSTALLQHEMKNYSTIVQAPLNGTKTEVLVTNRKRLAENYDLI